MFSKIWHGSLIAAIVMYSGNIFFATEPCQRIERSGSIVRVAATGLFFLTDNWMTKPDQLSFRKKANGLDLWLEDIVRVTFFGKEFHCVANSAKDTSESNQATSYVPTTPAQQAIAKAAAKTAKATRAPVVEAADTPVIVNNNPYNLPSLPDEVKR